MQEDPECVYNTKDAVKNVIQLLVYVDLKWNKYPPVLMNNQVKAYKAIYNQVKFQESQITKQLKDATNKESASQPTVPKLKVSPVKQPLNRDEPIHNSSSEDEFQQHATPLPGMQEDIHQFRKAQIDIPIASVITDD